MPAQVFAWDVGGKFLDECSGGRERLLSFGLSCLGLIELAQGDANAPEHWSQSLRSCHFLCNLQHSFSFCSPAECGQRFTMHFREAGIAMPPREITRRGDQLVNDLESQARITEGLRKFRSRIPDEPLPYCLHRSIRTKRSSENGLGACNVLLCQIDGK